MSFCFEKKNKTLLIMQVYSNLIKPVHSTKAKQSKRYFRRRSYNSKSGYNVANILVENNKDFFVVVGTRCE